MKLEILIPRYNEPFELLKPMLDSIEIQQNIDFNEIGVIIVNDGRENLLNEELFSKYSYKIQYFQNEHKGVSATRNACLDKATADYVMFCDCDDMFFNALGLFIIMEQIEHNPFDTLISTFLEETRFQNQIGYFPHEMDSTFVHGKVHRRKYLTDNNIRFKDELTIHEDSYFNMLCQKLANPNRVLVCTNPFYLWKWNDNSVCRRDPKYMLKTYVNMLDSNSSLVEEMLKRGLYQLAKESTVFMFYDMYFTLNKDEWLLEENKEYREMTEKKFKSYYDKYKHLFDSLLPQEQAPTIMGLKNRFYREGMLMEKFTFNDWISHIQKDFN